MQWLVLDVYGKGEEEEARGGAPATVGHAYLHLSCVHFEDSHVEHIPVYNPADDEVARLRIELRVAFLPHPAPMRVSEVATAAAAAPCCDAKIGPVCSWASAVSEGEGWAHSSFTLNEKRASLDPTLRRRPLQHTTDAIRRTTAAATACSSRPQPCCPLHQRERNH